MFLMFYNYINACNPMSLFLIAYFCPRFLTFKSNWTIVCRLYHKFRHPLISKRLFVCFCPCGMGSCSFNLSREIWFMKVYLILFIYIIYCLLFSLGFEVDYTELVNTFSRMGHSVNNTIGFGLQNSETNQRSENRAEAKHKYWHNTLNDAEITW